MPTRQLIPLFLLLLSACSSQPPSPSVTSQGSAVSGHYPNFLARAGYSQQQIDAKLEKAFAQLFYGDADTQTLYYPAGANANGPLAYIYDVNSNDVRSEGMSYGMMIAVQMNKKAEFDAIWNWSMTHMYHDNPAHPAYGYFAWSVETTGEAIDEMPAPDGEEYFVTALYFAAKRWGNGEGIYDYKKYADRILTDMRHRQLITGDTNRGQMTAGNLFSEEHKMVRFTPDVVNAEHTDASYHLPAFYEIWARVGPQADRSFWAEAADVSREYFNKASHPVTALTPDYGNFDGSPWPAPWRNASKDFRFDAWRTAMNWSMDWVWWRKNPQAPILSNKLQAFFHAQGIHSYGNQYTLAGQKLDDGQPTGIVAMNATASMAATHAIADDFIHALWLRQPPEGQFRYYDGVLYMMALLHLSGEYKAWL